MAFEGFFRHFFKIFRVRYLSKENSIHPEWLKLTLHKGYNGNATNTLTLANIKTRKKIKRHEEKFTIRHYVMHYFIL